MSRYHSTSSGYLPSGILSRRHSTFSGYLTSGILSSQRSISSGCLTSGILSANIPPPSDISHPKFCPPMFHLLRMSHIRNSVRRHSTSSGYLTSGILSGQRSISSVCLTSGILSADVPSPPDISHPEFCPADNSYSPDSLAHQTLTIRRIHFCPQSSAPLDFNKHEQNS